MASFSNAGFGAEPEEQAGLMGKASELAKGLRHPMPALFHVLFKSLAIVTYLFGDWFSASFVNVFVVCVLLLAFDFWTVKNVSGRLMVGLRWWSEVQEDGSQHWRFEAQEENLQSTTLDIGVFWVGLIAPAVIWVLLGVGMFLRLKFDWLLLVGTALALSGANIIGYVRCKSDARAKITSAVTNRLGGSFATQAMQSAAGKAFGF
mmetsp:Transcript_32097/g.75794  ORF Transcript_32097/g.75794 Transcript_32097/m.75794 type:complete len:205 (-) Transcript_32097:159-773(-)